MSEPTPRTDELIEYNMKNGAVDFSRDPIDLCRELERALAAQRTKLQQLEDAIKHGKSHVELLSILDKE